MSSDPAPPSETARPTPYSILEAGGEAVGILLAAIGQSIEDLIPGQVLEVVSSQPLAGEAVRGWCQATGHELIGLVAGFEGEQFWIRKR